MAIKVKHDMNAAPAAAAGVASGRARRAVETAKLFAGGTGSGSRGGGTTGAQAHPVAPMGAHAQLTHASAPVVAAHAPAYHDTIDDRLRLQEEQNLAALERQQLGVDAAKERSQMGIDAAKERSQMGIDATQGRLEQSQEFTAGQNRLREEFLTKQQADKLKAGQEERDWRAQQEEAKRKAQQEEWDRQHNILRTDHDADLVAAGTHEWGYTPQAEQQIKEMRDDLTKRISEDYLDEADILQAEEELAKKIAAIPKTAVRRMDPISQFNQRKTTQGGREGYINSKGDFVPFDDGQLSLRERELDAKRLEALRMQAQRYEESLRKPRKISRLVDDEDASGGKRKEDFYEERSEEEILGLLQKRFPLLYPSDTPHPSVQPQLQPPAQTAQPQQPTAQQPQDEDESDLRITQDLLRKAQLGLAEGFTAIQKDGEDDAIRVYDNNGKYVGAVAFDHKGAPYYMTPKEQGGGEDSFHDVYYYQDEVPWLKKQQEVTQNSASNWRQILGW